MPNLDRSRVLPGLGSRRLRLRKQQLRHEPAGDQPCPPPPLPPPPNLVGAILYDNDNGLFTVGPGGSTQVTTNCDEGRWSPDGTQIAFDRIGDFDNDVEIWRMTADGQGQTRLTFSEMDDEAAWSPDGDADRL